MSLPSAFRLALHASALGALAAAAPAQLIGTWPVPAFPTGNPTSQSGIDPNAALREDLGKLLFWDEQLSHDRSVACATCHAIEFGGNDKHGGAPHPGFDGIPGTADDSFGSPGVVRQDPNGDYAADPFFGVGQQATGLNAPTMIGAAFFEKLFWDKRAGPTFSDLNGNQVNGFGSNAALEDQASGPPANSVEMGHDGIAWAAIEQKLPRLVPLALASNIPPTFPVVAGQTYQQLFDAAFGVGPVTREKASIVLASYMRTLIPDQAPVDLGTMTPSQVAGLNLFRSRGCQLCHSNGGTIQFNAATQTFGDPNDLLFSDGLGHNIQLVGHNVFPPNFTNHDFGGPKTPTLRNVGLRKRLFHSGHVTSLAQAMALQYNNPATPVTFRFQPLLNATEQAQVLDFLQNALTDPRVANAQPPFDHPTLRGDVVPFGQNQVGPGSPGTGGVTPTMISNAPPKLGNAAWKFGLGDALPGALVQLWLAPQLNPGQVIGGIPFELDRMTAQLVGTFTVGANGTVTVKRAIGTNPALLGVELDWQWLVVDPAAVGGKAASPAATFTIF
ncbi:MAG: cytochrome-c peroxidase [Planctomycetota bacterium]